MVCEPFLSYWRNNGGADRFGFPLTGPRRETVGDWVGTVQYFERYRMEHHVNAGWQRPGAAGAAGQRYPE
ncbi:MAG: hypothetical protein HC893_09900 [Chloroflexaceae bacterium]|nr:hypothetical protein [Chloroflexaceae bacterium]